MAQEMTYAQALNEAKQVIIQQQYRIKADGDKIRSQQQTIVDQSGALSEGDRQNREQSAEISRISDELRATHDRLTQVTTAKEQAEAVVDRQGERLTSLQSTVAELERRSADQLRIISELTSERDAVRGMLPTAQDAEALQAMNDLLSRRPVSRGTPSMRLAGDGSSDQSASSQPAQAEAA